MLSPYLYPLTVCFVLLFLGQIAPAESPDVTERMVIITGTPEAQFKVNIKNINVSIDMQWNWTNIHTYSCFLKKKQCIIIILLVVCCSKKQWIAVCPHFSQSLLASFPPLYSRPKVGYLGSWRRRIFSQRRRRSNWRRILRFPRLRLAGSSVKAAKRWVKWWSKVEETVPFIHIYFNCVDSTVYCTVTLPPLQCQLLKDKSPLSVLHRSDYYICQIAPGWLGFIKDCFRFL